MIKYSVILRAYNAGAYLDKSIQSVLNQNYTNWEMIIVNDGSIDNTQKIAEQYAKEDSRIRVINQENKGGALATLTGVAASTGDYVSLLDADDWYEKEYLEQVNQAVISSNADMVVLNYNIIDFNGERLRFQFFAETCVLTEAQAMELFLRTTNAALWNKVVKRDKVKYNTEYKDFFDTAGKTTNFGDDLYLLMPVLCDCKIVCFIPDYLYNYVINNGSITHQSIKDPWVEVLLRTRLMETTYRLIERQGYMTDAIHDIIQWNAVSFIIQYTAYIVKSFLFETEHIRQLRRNLFYKSVVAKISCRKLVEKFRVKTVIGFVLFNRLVLRI